MGITKQRTENVLKQMPLHTLTLQPPEHRHTRETTINEKEE